MFRGRMGRIVGDVGNRIEPYHAATHLKGDTVIRPAGAELDVRLAVCTNRSQLQNPVLEPNQGGIHVHCIKELFGIKLVRNFLHHTLLEAGRLEL